MSARGLATCAAITALAVAGCGGDEPAPFKEVKQPTATTPTPTATVDTPMTDADPLASLSAKQQQALASLVTAQAGLAARGDALGSAGADADKLVNRIKAGFTAPSGSAPEVRRLATALTSFAAATGSIAEETDLLPALSTQLQLRFAALAKKQPTVAAHVLDAKREVDNAIQTLAGLRLKLDSYASDVKDQLSAVELDAHLGETIGAASESKSVVLGEVNQAVDMGVRALADAA
jgi:hypothetical protein